MSTLTDRLFAMLIVGVLIAGGLMTANPGFAGAAVVVLAVALPLVLKVAGHPIHKIEVTAVLFLAVGLGRIGAACMVWSFGGELYLSGDQAWYVGPTLTIGTLLACVSHGMADSRPRPAVATLN